MAPSAAIETLVKHQVSRLDRFYDHIVACKVTIEAPHSHHHQGKRFKVSVAVVVPGDTLMVTHEGENDPAHEDCYVTVQDAFRSARRQLQDYARLKRNQVKNHNRDDKRQFRAKLAEDDQSSLDEE
jgi:ribosome-associated translation inhibitor RaiA